ncbi:ABC transporter ATP-binding protein [Halobacillus sp. K22]|uniref:ABC transporter ATP-binding protein n=1 Tax=Halobacillus sp. K22 TaxID=3457431 RepID=UPI003FCD4D98
MTTLLEVEKLRKTYTDSDFGLHDVTFSIPYGSICGFIGGNGAGKSTTMNAILGTRPKDSGTIKFCGKELTNRDVHMKDEIGVVFDTVKLPDVTVEKIEKVFQNIYTRWDQGKFYHYVDFFSLPRKKSIGHFSRGMSMKLSMCVALSHDAKLLLLDEATAGLDPEGRNDMLEVLRDFVADQQRSILLSSHITSDIEKVADRLIFMKEGKVLLSVDKEDLFQRYAIIQCDPAQFEHVQKESAAFLKNGDKLEALVSKTQHIASAMKDKPFSIDDIALLLMKGEKE